MMDNSLRYNSRILISFGVIGVVTLGYVVFHVSSSRPTVTSADLETFEQSNIEHHNSGRMAKTIVYPKVILYGDSITQRSFSEGQWGTYLADKLIRRCDVLNRGFSGYTSRWNLFMLPQLFSSEDAPHIAAVTLFLGANDSNKPPIHLHVPLDEYSTNMKKIIQELIAMGIVKEKIIVISTPPVDEVAWTKDRGGHGQVSYKDNILAGKYADAGKQVAEEMGTNFIDLYHSMMEKEGWQRFLIDGLHFSEEGSKFLSMKLWPVMEKLTRKLPLIMPDWTDFTQNPPTFR